LSGTVSGAVVCVVAKPVSIPRRASAARVALITVGEMVMVRTFQVGWSPVLAHRVALG
jgi:hypothetical protein